MQESGRFHDATLLRISLPRSRWQLPTQHSATPFLLRTLARGPAFWRTTTHVAQLPAGGDTKVAWFNLGTVEHLAVADQVAPILRRRILALTFSLPYAYCTVPFGYFSVEAGARDGLSSNSAPVPCDYPFGCCPFARSVHQPGACTTPSSPCP